MSRSIEVITSTGEPVVIDVGEMLTVDFDWIAGQLAAEDVDLFCFRLEIDTRNLSSSVASSVSSMNKSRQLKFSGIDAETLIRFRLVPGDFPILLRDRGMQWEVKMQPEDTISDLKRKVAEYREKTAGHSTYTQIDQRTLERIHLTHRGKELSSNDRISQVSINYYRADTATPLREMSVDADLIVTIRDENFHSNEETVYLQNSWNLERLKKAYEEKTKRNLVWESEREGGRRHYDQGTKQECKFYLIQRGMANDEEKGDDERKIILNKSQSLYEQGIDDDSTIILEPAPFRLQIVEKKKTGGVLDEGKDNQITLTGVYDYWSVKRLKDEYNQRLTDMSTGILPENLDSNDILLYNGRELTPDSSDLCSFNIIDNAQLIIKREDLTQIACLYVCSDCGVDVRLKRSDAVRCRECGNRIVFKKRENKPLQHICR